MIELFVRVNGSEAMYLNAKKKKGEETLHEIAIRLPQAQGRMKKLGELEMDEDAGVGPFAKEMIQLLEDQMQ